MGSSSGANPEERKKTSEDEKKKRKLVYRTYPIAWDNEKRQLSRSGGTEKGGRYIIHEPRKST